MSCNGFNHPPDCDCGWGGVFHAKSGELFYGTDYWSREQSHTNPNARCPVCGAMVFFYRSPDNGRVYFDALGPPWPKHPCTSGEPVKSSKAIALKPARGYGWMPFLCVKAYRIPEHRCLAIEDAQGRTLYLATGAPRIHPDTPIWLRRSDLPGQYLLSTLRNKNGGTYEVGSRAYRTLGRLLTAQQQQLEAKRAASAKDKADEADFNAVALQGKTLPEPTKSEGHRKPILHLGPRPNRLNARERVSTKLSRGPQVTDGVVSKGSGSAKKAGATSAEAQEQAQGVLAPAKTKMALAFIAAQEALKSTR